MDGEIESHELSELGIIVAQHVGEIVRPIQVGIDGSNAAALTVQVAVDLSRHTGKLGNQVHGVLIHKLNQKKSNERQREYLN